MPRYLSWIGEKESAGFHWDDVPHEAVRGNQPNWRVPRSQYRWRGLGFGYGFYRKVSEAGEFQCKQLDWGGWGILVTRDDCIAIWDQALESYAGSERLRAVWEDIRTDIEALEPGTDYVLFIAEQP